MAGSITLTGRQLEIAEQLLSDVASSFVQFEIPYWLEGGTLLGIVRENRLLPWDNDVDLSIHAGNSAGLSEVIRHLNSSGYRIRVRRFEKESSCFKAGDVRLIKVRKKHWFGLGKSKVCLDIFVKYTQGDQVYWMVNNLVKSVPGKFYQEFDSINFKDQDYSIPRQYSEYLQYRYGNWQEPVKQWNTFVDDKALLTTKRS